MPIEEKESSILEPIAPATTTSMAEVMVTVLAANAANMRRSNIRHSNGESGGTWLKLPVGRAVKDPTWHT